MIHQANHLIIYWVHLTSQMPYGLHPMPSCTYGPVGCSVSPPKGIQVPLHAFKMLNMGEWLGSGDGCWVPQAVGSHTKKYAEVVCSTVCVHFVTRCVMGCPGRD